jgi:hypothetical protein
LANFVPIKRSVRPGLQVEDGDALDNRWHVRDLRSVRRPGGILADPDEYALIPAVCFDHKNAEVGAEVARTAREGNRPSVRRPSRVGVVSRRKLSQRASIPVHDVQPPRSVVIRESEEDEPRSVGRPVGIIVPVLARIGLSAHLTSLGRPRHHAENEAI